MKTEVVAKVLGFETRPWTNKEGVKRTFASLTVVSETGSVLRFDANPDFNFGDLKDKDATLTLEFTTFGDSISPRVRVVSAEEV